jgi:hypothetical protein
MPRQENLEFLLGFRHPDPSVWEVPEDLPRWAAVECDGFGEDGWIAFFDTQEEATAYFFSGEGNWFPVCVYDLDTGQAYSVKIECKIGEEMTL